MNINYINAAGVVISADNIKQLDESVRSDFAVSIQRLNLLHPNQFTEEVIRMLADSFNLNELINWDAIVKKAVPEA